MEACPYGWSDGRLLLFVCCLVGDTGGELISSATIIRLDVVVGRLMPLAVIVCNDALGCSWPALPLGFEGIAFVIGPPAEFEETNEGCQC